MRKLKLFFACLLMTVLSIGQVWADSFTITFKGTGTSNDGSSALSSTTVADYVSDGASYVSAISASGKVFIGQQAWGLKFGNSSNPGTVTLTLKDALKPDSIVINASPWSATEGKGVLQDSVFNTTKTGAKGTFANFKYVYDGNTEVTTITLGTNSNGKRGYVKSVTVFYTSEAPSYTISAQSNDNSKGTVSLSGSVITGSPKAGFRYASPAYSVSPANSATVSQNGNAFTVTPSANTTVTINFEAIPTYTVQFSTGNGNPAVESKTETVSGAGITLPEGPTPTCSADGWVFAGWAEAAVASETTTAPTLLSGTYHPTADITLYAVYKKTIGGDGAAVNTVMWSEDWSGATSANRTPTSPTSTATVYGSATVEYAWTNGDSETKLYDDTSGPHTDANNWNVLVGKNNGNLTISGIPTGKASTLTLNYAVAGSGTIGVSTTTENVSISGSTITIEDAEVTAFDLIFTNSHASKNGRIDDISVAVATSSAAGTTTYLSAPSCAAPTCEDLGTPVVTVTNKTYNSAKLTWAAVANADKYLVKFNGVDQTATGDLYFDATNLDAATTYTYQVKALAEEGQDDWCDGEFTTEANFTTESAPAATLTLSEIGETHNFAGDHIVGETVTLPLSATECSKTFVGWDPASNCTSAPAYAPGESYTLAATTQTLYAVYATPVGAATYVKTALASIPSGSEVVVTELYNETIYAAANDGGTSAGPAAVEVTETTNVLNVGSNTNIFWTITKSGDNFSLTVKGGTAKLYCTNTNNGVRVGTNENNVFSIKNNYLYNNATSRYVGYNHGDGGLFRCYTTINTNINEETLAFYKKNVSYEDYSTTCAAALAAPTFSVDPDDGPFDTEISVELEATEGTIYYTLNGTDPTNESTEYIDPIVLNTCGNKTIKAIAISSTNHSAVAIATYEMNIPVPTNSQVAPYSPTEAREVIASGCYDGSTIMYVKGVVKSTTEYSSTYGNYDIVVRNIGNESSETFKYYHMYKASGNSKFTADENIEEGDTILAAGVLTLYGSTYEFANNTCYMVEHKKIASKTSIANDPPAEPYTVAQAINFINNSVTYDLSEEVYVKGVVTAINNSGTKYIDIKDAGASNTFRFYNCNFNSFSVNVNDTIVGKGILYLHGTSTYEFNGCVLTAVTAYVAPIIAVESVELDETAISLKEGLSTTLVATVNPTEASNKNVTWESSNPAVATVDNGEITAVAIGTTTITVTTVDGGYTATCTVTVNDASARDLPNAAFQKVTSTSQITDGKYLIVYAAAGVDTVAFDGALTTLDAVGNTIDVIIDGDYVVAPGDAAFTIDVTAGTLKSYSGKYIGVSSNSNGLKETTNAETYTNAFAIDDNKAVISAVFSGSTMTMRYNTDSNQKRFRYYKGTSSYPYVQLYKMVEPEEIRDNLNDGKWGTICPAKKVLAPVGASFYKLNYMELNPDGSPYKFFFDEIGENAYLEAGKPYLFIAEGTTITGVKVGDAADDGDHAYNGFVGYLGAINKPLASDAYTFTNNGYNYYGLQNNIFKLIGNGQIVNERAFIQITPNPEDNPATTEQATPKYSRRRLVVGAGAPQVTTGTENIEASETPVKVMIDGNLFILRGEKMYDATGRLVK